MTTLKTLKLYNCHIHLFEVPIYKSKICFIKYKSKEGFKKAIDFLNKIKFNTSDFDSEDYFNCYGFVDKCFTSKELGTIHVLFINTGKDYIDSYNDTLNHEGNHLIQGICEHHGLTHIKGGANEHIAYLTGYIMDYLLKK